MNTKLFTTNVLCIKDCYEEDSDTLIYKEGEIYQTDERYHWFIMDEKYCQRQWSVDLKVTPDFFIYFQMIPDEQS